ncbi:MAG: thioredoxin family protein [Kiritimatiellae bacterium]|nr:thioredoxin family protein [Kiritimatiellia bacterium]
MTTRETPYYATAEEETPLGSLPPYVTLSILELGKSSSRMTITFEAASGSWITAFVDKELIDASFYATPEPYYPTRIEETPEPTPTPVPTPTPLPPDAQRITLTHRTPAYDPANSLRIVGYFPQGIEILVLSNADAQAFSHVLYISGDGREIRAICRQVDILPPTLPQPGALSALRRNEEVDPLKWLENQEGYKEALSLQRRTKYKILLYFHTSWNNDCKTLSEELLMTSDFLQETREIIKVSINPEEGKKDADLAAKYDVSILPTTLVLDAPGSEPRKIKLLKKMYGKARVVDVPKALAIIETTQ